MGKYLLVIVFASFLLAACVSDQKKKSHDLETELEQLEEKQESDTKITYKVPSPLETFIYIKANDGTYLEELTNPHKNVDHYLSSRKKALNFGVYSSDMVYTTINGDIEKTIELFGTCKTLSEELGIHGGFGQTIANRIDRNLYNIDSLSKLTTESYWESCKYLEESGMSDYLSLILCGGYIETTYIVGQTIENLDVKDPLTKRFIEQGVILENIIDYMESQDNEEFTDVLKTLEKLQSHYDEVYEMEPASVSKDQLKKLLAEVTKIREKIISI